MTISNLVPIEIKGHQLEIDVLDELQQFDWKRSRITQNSFIACSPFRDEKKPSFAVSLRHGGWSDWGNDHPQWQKGRFPRLLAYLRNATIEEIEEYLLSKYRPFLDLDGLKLNLDLDQIKQPKKVFSSDDLKKYRFRHPYLANRGIPEKVQRAFKIGYDMEHKAVVIPWFNFRNEIINLKFRSVYNKVFWYASAGQPIGNHIFGINFIYKKSAKIAYLVESEIDAMYLWGHGFPAIALGGSNLTDVQKTLILQSSIEKLVIASDNDAAGERLKNKLVRCLAGLIHLFSIDFSTKDVNELSPVELKNVCNNYFPLDRIFLDNV